MDSAMYGDDLGVVDTRIADGELTRRGMGTAKKVAVGAGALVAGAGAFMGGCKLAGKLDNNLLTKWQGINAAHKSTFDAAAAAVTRTEGMTDAAFEAAKNEAGKKAVKDALEAGTLEKKSIFNKLGTYNFQQGIFGEGILGKKNFLGGPLSNHWKGISENLAIKSAAKQLTANGSTLTGDALRDAAKQEITKEGFKAGLGSKIFGTMSNYPILAAAGLAGAGFFIYKGIKKLINKHKGVEEPSFGR